MHLDSRLRGLERDLAGDGLMKWKPLLICHPIIVHRPVTLDIE